MESAPTAFAHDIRRGRFYIGPRAHTVRPYNAFALHQSICIPPQISVAFRRQLRYTFNKPFPILRDIVKEFI